MKDTLEKYTISFGLAFVITGLFSALLVVIKELSGGVLGVMKNATGHHWVTHTVVDVIVFFALGFLLTKVVISSQRLQQMIIGVAVLGSVIIAGFYLIEG